MRDVISSEYTAIILAIVVVVMSLVVAILVRRFLDRLVRRARSEGDDATTLSFFRYVLSLGIFVMGCAIAVYMVPSLRSLGKTLLAGAGVLALAVGFASQQALSNIIGGLFVTLFKPFRIGHRVSLRANSLSGVVEDITLRHTVIRDWRNRRIIIPNSIISDEIVLNADLNESVICNWVEIGISYDSDVTLAKSIMCEEALAHPDQIDNRTDEEKAAGEDEVKVRVIQLADSAVLLRAWVWSLDLPGGTGMTFDLLESIKARFDAEGIEIPFPHRTVVQKT